AHTLHLGYRRRVPLHRHRVVELGHFRTRSRTSRIHRRDRRAYAADGALSRVHFPRRGCRGPSVPADGGPARAPDDKRRRPQLMTGLDIGAIAIAALLLLILLGMPIGVAMMVSSFGAVAFIRNETVAISM